MALWTGGLNKSERAKTRIEQFPYQMDMRMRGEGPEFGLFVML